MRARGWFADWDEDATTDFGWQPCFETGEGHVPCFQMWFNTKAECERWIADCVLGVGWFPGDPTEMPAPDTTHPQPDRPGTESKEQGR